MGKLFDELKRRNVVRVGIAYIVLGWVALQVGDILFDTMPSGATAPAASSMTTRSPPRMRWSLLAQAPKLARKLGEAPHR